MSSRHRTTVEEVRALYESDVLIDTFNRAFAGHWHFRVEPTLTGAPSGERWLCERLGLHAEHRLLDFGSGVGSTTCRIAGWTGCRARGLNISVKQVTIGNTLADRLGLRDRVQFDLYDGVELPYAAGSFDRAIFFESVCQVPHKALVFRELFRVLAAGGILAGQDWVLTSDRISDEDYARYILPIEAAVEVKLASLEEYRDLMCAAGFEDVRIVDAREVDPRLDREFVDPPGEPVVILPEDDVACRLEKGALALRSAFHRGLFTIGFVHGRVPGARCRLLGAEAIDSGAYSVSKNRACVEHHRRSFGVADRPALGSFVDLVESSSDCSVEPSCKVEGEETHSARFNLFHHGGRNEEFLSDVLGFFDAAAAAEGIRLDLVPVRSFLDAGVGFGDVQKVVTGIDLRDDPRRSRLKLWFMLARGRHLATRALELFDGDRALVEALRFHDAFLVGFDLGFDGRTRLKLYPDVERAELEDEHVCRRLSTLLSDEAVGAMRQCVWTHVYVREQGREVVLQFHPTEPDDFVTRNLPARARSAIHRAYAGTDLLDMVVALPLGELGRREEARSYGLYYMPARAPG